LILLISASQVAGLPCPAKSHFLFEEIMVVSFPETRKYKNMVEPENIKNKFKMLDKRLTPVILVIWEAEIGRITV
jgi:hypothetical protein